MDARAQQVAAEVVEAGLEALGEVEAPAWEKLNLAFLGLGDALHSAYLGTFVRSFESAQEDSPEAVQLREKVALDLHRKAVSIVTAGARVAALAYQLKGSTEPEAKAAAGWRLRSEIAEDGWAGASEEKLMANAHQNYVLAAASLHQLNSESASPDEIDSFAHSVLADVVGFAVSAAAEARAVESPA